MLFCNDKRHSDTLAMFPTVIKFCVYREITSKSTNVIVEDVPALFRVCSLSHTINCVAKDEWISQTQ